MAGENPRSSISHFQLETVLNIDPRMKSAAVCGRVKDGSDSLAVAVLHKEGFDSKELQALFAEDVEWTPFLTNDIYGGYTISNPPKSQGTIKATFIHPATEKHVAKYTRQEFYFCIETPAIFASIVRPHFLTMKFSLQWVYNIIEHKKEADRIVFEDYDDKNGFIMLPDLKWNGEKPEELYLVAIVRRKDLGSLRDLRHEHIHLLENILIAGKEAVKRKYGVPGSKLKIFVHHHPTYQHFHVHFLHITMEGFGSGVERGHLLSNVISNLGIDSDYYQKADLAITVRHDDPLKTLLENAGALEL